MKGESHDIKTAFMLDCFKWKQKAEVHYRQVVRLLL